MRFSNPLNGLESNVLRSLVDALNTIERVWNEQRICTEGGIDVENGWYRQFGVIKKTLRNPEWRKDVGDRALGASTARIGSRVNLGEKHLEDVPDSVGDVQVEDVSILVVR